VRGRLVGLRLGLCVRRRLVGLKRVGRDLIGFDFCFDVCFDVGFDVSFNVGCIVGCNVGCNVGLVMLNV
jgi:hypothetical protein